MQWERAKSILLAILLAVNLFLTGSLFFRLYTARERDQAVVRHLQTLLAQHDFTLDQAFVLPADTQLPLLFVDRSIAHEQAVSETLLEGDSVRTEQSDGTLRYTRGTDWVSWQADGMINASLSLPSFVSTVSDPVARVQKLVTDAGLAGERALYTPRAHTIEVTEPIAGHPVYTQSLSVRFSSDGKRLYLHGAWMLGTPYAIAGDAQLVCTAADSLLRFVRTTGGGTLQSMELGYVVYHEASRRVRLQPTWRICVDEVAYWVDCSTRSVIVPT